MKSFESSSGFVVVTSVVVVATVEVIVTVETVVVLVILVDFVGVMSLVVVPVEAADVELAVTSLTVVVVVCDDDCIEASWLACVVTCVVFVGLLVVIDEGTVCPLVEEGDCVVAEVAVVTVVGLAVGEGVVTLLLTSVVVSDVGSVEEPAKRYLT